ncbi:MAG: hypothetical protein IJU35_04445 [Paludibacteraceae bacterium]|nr:hypothetical protein [Paludibacteraceae bacterium]
MKTFRIILLACLVIASCSAADGKVTSHLSDITPWMPIKNMYDSRYSIDAETNKGYLVSQSYIISSAYSSENHKDTYLLTNQMNIELMPFQYIRQVGENYLVKQKNKSTTLFKLLNKDLRVVSQNEFVKEKNVEYIAMLGDNYLLRKVNKGKCTLVLLDRNLNPMSEQVIDDKCESVDSICDPDNNSIVLSLKSKKSRSIIYIKKDFRQLKKITAPSRFSYLYTIQHWTYKNLLCIVYRNNYAIFAHDYYLAINLDDFSVSKHFCLLNTSLNQIVRNEKGDKFAVLNDAPTLYSANGDILQEIKAETFQSASYDGLFTEDDKLVVAKFLLPNKRVDSGLQENASLTFFSLDERSIIQSDIITLSDKIKYNVFLLDYNDKNAYLLAYSGDKYKLLEVDLKTKDVVVSFQDGDATFSDPKWKYKTKSGWIMGSVFVANGFKYVNSWDCSLYPYPNDIYKDIDEKHITVYNNETLRRPPCLFLGVIDNTANGIVEKLENAVSMLRVGTSDFLVLLRQDSNLKLSHIHFDIE